VGIFETLGVQPIINLAGTSTRLGGALMTEEVISAMVEASADSVAMVELQAVGSELIAAMTGAEAGYVTSGAAAGLTLATAACLAGLDVGRIEVLPDTNGNMPNQVIIAREHRNGYDHAIRAAGAKLVEVGMNEILSGAGVRAAEAWEFEIAIGAETAAIAYVARPGSAPPLEEVVAIARQHRVPVIVDAASQLPPVQNLRSFIDKGADLVVFSGGKALRGPQNTGIIAGRRELIASVALQNLDLDETFEIWDPPRSLIPKDELRGLPRHGVGRGFKVSKEAVVGLLTALRLFTPEKCKSDAQQLGDYLDRIANGLADVPGVRAERVSRPDPEMLPILHITIDRKADSPDALDIARQLKAGSPPIYVNESLLRQGTLVLNAMNLNDERAALVVERMHQVFAGTPDGVISRAIPSV
jgi:D-glucosaminate-6-phosphate ammonia-lyase